MKLSLVSLTKAAGLQKYTNLQFAVTRDSTRMFVTGRTHVLKISNVNDLIPTCRQIPLSYGASHTAAGWQRFNDYFCDMVAFKNDVASFHFTKCFLIYGHHIIAHQFWQNRLKSVFFFRYRVKLNFPFKHLCWDV